MNQYVYESGVASSAHHPTVVENLTALYRQEPLSVIGQFSQIPISQPIGVFLTYYSTAVDLLQVHPEKDRIIAELDSLMLGYFSDVVFANLRCLYQARALYNDKPDPESPLAWFVNRVSNIATGIRTKVLEIGEHNLTDELMDKILSESIPETAEDEDPMVTTQTTVAVALALAELTLIDNLPLTFVAAQSGIVNMEFKAASSNSEKPRIISTET